MSPWFLLKSIKKNQELIYHLAQREILSRYRGSALGLLWSFFNPLVMLTIYTFVFSVVFKARWGGDSDSKVEFALVLFAGLMIFNLFSECINKAPGLVLSNVNYVKRVVFPLEILPVVTLLSAIFHLIISLFVWLLFYIIFVGMPPLTILLLPLVYLPFALIILGFSWFLASLGVYLRDIIQIIGVLTTVLMFLSPLFYPISSLPEQYRTFMLINPLTFVIEQARGLMIFGTILDWKTWALYSILSILIVFLGFAWFQKTRKGFADVL